MVLVVAMLLVRLVFVGGDGSLGLLWVLQVMTTRQE